MLPRILLGRSGKLPWYLAGFIPAANCIAAYQPLGASSYAASKVNLINPGTYDLSNGTAFPAWDTAIGWTFTAASSQYLTVAAGALVTAVPLSLVIRFAASRDDADYDPINLSNNALNEAFRLTLGGVSLADCVGAWDAGSAQGVASSAKNYTSGNWFTGAAVFRSTTSRDAYMDGEYKGSDATLVNTAIPNKTVIGGVYWNGVPVNFMDGSISACAIYNIALSDAQVLAVHTAMLALGL